MESEKKDIVITALEFAKSRSLMGTPSSAGELWVHLLSEKLVSDKDTQSHFVSHLWAKICAGAAGDHGYMSLDAYLGLLDYEELKQARKDSQEARAESKVALKYARWSIWIAIGLGVVQIVVGLVS